MSTLISEIRTVVKTVGQSPINGSVEEQSVEDQPSGPVDRKKGRKVAFAKLPLNQEDDLDLEKFDDDGDADLE